MESGFVSGGRGSGHGFVEGGDQGELSSTTKQDSLSQKERVGKGGVTRSGHANFRSTKQEMHCRRGAFVCV